MMNDEKFGRLVTTESAYSNVSTHLTTDHGWSPQVSPESMNSTPMAATAVDVATNVMVEGLVCADTSMDLYLTKDSANVEAGTPYEIKASDMYQGLVCGDTSMDVHLAEEDDQFSPCTLSDNGNIEEGSQYETKTNVNWGLICGDSSLDIHVDKEQLPLASQTKQSLPTVEMFQGLVCADSSLDLHLTSDDDNIEMVPRRAFVDISEQVRYAYYAAFVVH